MNTAFEPTAQTPRKSALLDTSLELFPLTALFFSGKLRHIRGIASIAGPVASASSLAILMGFNTCHGSFPANEFAGSRTSQ